MTEIKGAAAELALLNVMIDEGVTNYRLCLLDEAGAIQEELFIFAQDDDEAIDMAGSHGHPYEMKLWKGPRLVGHFPSFNDWDFGCE